MPNRKLLICQKKYYMNLRNSGGIQKESALKSDISIRTARRLDSNGINSLTTIKKRNWKTRKDPLSPIWQSELEPLLKLSPELQPITLFEYLEDKYPGQYQHNILRTLQRRIKHWKVINGKNQEVMFPQKHYPGQMGISDFTVFNNEVTINGEAFDHRLYHYRLVYSKWAYVCVIQGGESYTALAQSLQNALIQSGGSPKEHRTDSLAAAYNNNNQKEIFTKSYQQFCEHYHIKPTRNNLGISHENGSIESAHGHFKNRIRQALILRNSKDFSSIAEYQEFIDKIISKHNKRYHSLFAEERKFLMELPKNKTEDFTVLHVKATSCSTINIKNVTYSIPSKLIGQKLVIHLFDGKLEIFYNHHKICELPRIYNKRQTKRKSCINYRHIISSLVQKPQAFKNFIWKDELFPNQDYQKIWQIAKYTEDSKVACKYFVKLLYLASKLSQQKEDQISNYILNYHQQKAYLPTIEHCEKQFGINNRPKVIPWVNTNQHQLEGYDKLLQTAVSF